MREKKQQMNNDIYCAIYEFVITIVQFCPQILSCSWEDWLKSEYSYSVVSFLPNKFTVLRQVSLVFPQILHILEQWLKTGRSLLFKEASSLRVSVSSLLSALVGIGRRFPQNMWLIQTNNERLWPSWSQKMKAYVYFCWALNSEKWGSLSWLYH